MTQKKPNWFKEYKGVIIPLGFIGFIIILGVITATTTPSAKYKAWIIGDSSTWAVTSPSKLSIAFHVKNIGNAPGTPNCTISANSPDDSDVGYDSITLQGVLQPGQENTSADTLTITNQGAANVTSATISC